MKIKFKLRSLSSQDKTHGKDGHFMINIIETFYNEYIKDCEEKTKKSSEYINLLNRITDNETWLKRYFDNNNLKEEKKVFIEYFMAQDSKSEIDEKEKFIDGFVTGAVLMMEIILKRGL